MINKRASWTLAMVQQRTLDYNEPLEETKGWKEGSVYGQ
jgi:hypothetical protein